MRLTLLKKLRMSPTRTGCLNLKFIDRHRGKPALMGRGGHHGPRQIDLGHPSQSQNVAVGIAVGGME